MILGLENSPYPYSTSLVRPRLKAAIANPSKCPVYHLQMHRSSSAQLLFTEAATPTRIEEYTLLCTRCVPEYFAGASRLSEERVRACSVCEARGAWHHSHFAPRCGFPGGAVRPLFQSKSRRWRASHRASPSHPPGGNHEYRTAETRTQADMGIKARVPDAPTLHALTPWHSPTRSRRPNPCPVAVAGSLHPNSNFPSTASCTRPL